MHGADDVQTASRWLASRRDDAVAAFCGVWMIAGLFTDGWAHRNQKPETFFSPWHAVLYSGSIASALWMLRMYRVGVVKTGTRGRNAIATGYGVRVLGVVVFWIGGLADLVWHRIFGIEVDIEALLSPSHLLLLSGGLLLALGPIASTLAREGRPSASWRSAGPIVLTMMFITSVLQFFVMYLSPFERYRYSRENSMAARRIGGDWLHDETVSVGVAGIMLITMLLVVPLLWAMRHCGLPRGAFVMMWAAPCVLQTALTSFATIDRVIGALVAAVAAEVLWRQTAMSTSRRPEIAWALLLAGMSLVTWLGLFGTVAVRAGLGWQVELWSGASAFAAILAGAITFATLSDAHRPFESLPTDTAR